MSNGQQQLFATPARLSDADLLTRLAGAEKSNFRYEDIAAYKRRTDERRLVVLEELAAQAQDLTMGY